MCTMQNGTAWETLGEEGDAKPEIWGRMSLMDEGNLCRGRVIGQMENTVTVTGEARASLQRLVRHQPELLQVGPQWPDFSSSRSQPSGRSAPGITQAVTDTAEPTLERAERQRLAMTTPWGWTQALP